jgi:DNA-binding SARP family transcriptional activator
VSVAVRAGTIRRVTLGVVGVIVWLGFGGAIAWALTWLLDYWHDGVYHHVAQIGVAVAIIGLALWAVATRALLREVRAGVRAERGVGLRCTRRGALATLLAPLAGPIVGMIVALVGITGSPHGVALGAPTAISVPAASHAPGKTISSDSAATRTYVVQPGDRIGAIAAHFYGDEADWVSIAKANMGRVEPDGARFVDPTVLRAGWTLVIPSVKDAETTDVTGAPSNGDTAGRDHLLFAALGGFGLLGSAVIAGSLVRRRRLQRLRASAGEVVPLQSDADAAAESAIRPLATAELPDWIDAMNRLLFAELVAEPSVAPPRVGVVRAGPNGVELLIDPPSTVTTPSFRVQDGGHSWRLDPTLELSEVRRRAGENTWAYLPVLVPFGETDDGSYLVAVGAGETLGVQGDPESMERALAMVATELGHAPWAEVETYRIGTTRAPGTAEWMEIEARHVGGLDPSEAADPLWRRDLVEAQPVVLVTDAADAREAVGERRGNVALVGPLVDADRVLYYEEGFVTVEPLGLRIPAHLPSLEELGVVERIGSNAASDVAPAPEDLQGLPPPETPIPQPGVFEVRLLRPIPDLVGDVPAQVPSSALRLIAYLAAHGGKATTNRLRDALGSYRQDDSRASQTIWHAATQARKVLGADRIPRAINREHYTLAEDVTCDWTRFEVMAKIARAAELVGDHDRAIETLTEALGLVEGPPASETNHFSWLEREQLLYGIERAVVDAAHRLFDLALTERSFNRAHWAIEQGRLLSPDDGELRRDAMRLAGERDDDAELAAEYAAAGEAVDSLHLGAEIDDTTDRTFTRLAARRSTRTPSAAP